VFVREIRLPFESASGVVIDRGVDSRIILSSVTHKPVSDWLLKSDRRLPLP